jgi:antitoxin component HigA of HigAB toxin-antitoxin module
MLFAASVAAGNGYNIRTPFRQSPLIYLALVADPGKLKSHPLAFAKAPLEKWDAEAFKEYEKAKRECESDEQAEKPTFKQNLVKDTTPEALVGVHQANPGGIGLVRDELSAWFETFDRYHKNADAQFWLSNWSLEAISINRKTTEPLFVERPFISVAGTIQSALLEKLAAHDRSQIGFLDRILFSYPTEIPAAKWSIDSDISREHDQWEGMLDQIAQASSNRFANGETTVPFQEKALEKVIEWQHANAEAIEDANRNANYSRAQMLSKLEVYALRLSLLLAILDKPEAPEITPGNVSQAISLVKYFEACGKQVREAAGAASLPDKRDVIQYLSKQGLKQNDIANALGDSRQYISKVLRGERERAG